MARKMLVMEDPVLTDRTEDCDELFGGGSGRIFGDDVDNNATIEDQVEHDRAEEDELEFALDALLKEVNVGEESYKTPTKGKSTVAISFEIEEFANVEVSLPPPNVGMVFDSWKKIDEYFRNYGKQEGFGVVRSSGTFVGKGVNAKEKKSVTWTCECFGMPGRKSKKTGPTFVSDSQISEELVKRKSKKVQCPVKLYAKVNEGGDWVIDKVELEHKGHAPTPGKSKNITKFRKKFLMDNPHWYWATRDLYQVAVHHSSEIP
ncbi:uncharacterized protein LOC110699460 [Chenopodium quinoa]|uniref:FAR1 domain-containing protein n=1 Tax=Chenopodium quinoa TaxID=63459 RepID=A0A803MUK1_CHEQI|nr:uncharacterized protein LOC110699460 [Chenopodium quinoa]